MVGSALIEQSFTDKEVRSYQDDMICDVDPWFWAVNKKIQLQGTAYSFEGHEWQAEPMRSVAQNRVIKKGAQLGFTEIEILKTLHGLISGRFPKGVLYLFPTSDDVSDFSKARFGPLIQSNPSAVGRFVRSTDSTNIKQIGTGILYLRGARLTANVEGLKKDSPKLRSVPVDKLVTDERDLMSDAAVLLALERLSHSDVKETVSFSTPTVPGYGIDRMYEESTQHLWMIKCDGCQREVCLETEFPNCVKNNRRVCIHCGHEVFPRNGRWVAQYPDRDVEGYWLSQLNSLYIEPGRILDLFNNPPQGNIQEIYNSKLGMAYIDAEDELTQRDVRTCCGLEPMLTSHRGPCAMGIDVGKELHVTIGYRRGDKQYRIVKVATLTDFSDVHDLAKRFNVKNAVIDALPETRTVRTFQNQENYEIFLCYYKESQATGPVFNLNTGIVQVNRTEICDQTHKLITETDRCELPRWNNELETYAIQMSSMFKRLEEDEKTGTKIYRYHKRGPDHYRHSTNYFYLAAQRVSQVRNATETRQGTVEMDYQILD